MMKRLFFLLAVFCLCMAKCWGEPLKVGVILGPPFVIKHEETYTGIAVDLWESVAHGLEEFYTFVEFPGDKVEEALNALKNEEIDVIIGPLSITHTGLTMADFSLPYYIDNIVALVYRDYFHNLPLLFNMMISSLGGIISLILIVFAGYLYCMWYYERNYTTSIPHKFREGIPHLFWNHIFIGKHSSEIPKSKQGKALILFKMVAFYIMLTLLSVTQISFLTASLTKWVDPIHTLADLQSRRVGAIDESRALKVGKSIGLKVFTFSSLEQGIAALEKKHVGAFLTNLGLADAYLKGIGKEDVHISQYVLKHDLYAFATRSGSPLLRKINLQMAMLRKNETTKRICMGYLEKGATACDL